MKLNLKNEELMNNSNLHHNYKKWIKEFIDDLLNGDNGCYLIPNDDDPEEMELVIGEDEYEMCDYERLEHLYCCYWAYNKVPNLGVYIEELIEEVKKSLNKLK